MMVMIALIVLTFFKLALYVMEEKYAAIQMLKAQLEQAEHKLKFHEAEAFKYRDMVVNFRKTLGYLEGNQPAAEAKSIADYAEIILKEHGQSKVDFLVKELEKRGVHATPQTVTGALSRYVRDNKRFRRLAPGTFALLKDDEK